MRGPSCLPGSAWCCGFALGRGGVKTVHADVRRVDRSARRRHRWRMALVQVRDLRFAFGTRTVLDGVAFDVASGEVVGLLGPNGAGKTTTLSVLATLRRPDAGTAIVAGHSTADAPAAVRAALGV